MNLSVEEEETHRPREQTCGCQARWGEGAGWTGSLGLGDANFDI